MLITNPKNRHHSSVVSIYPPQQSMTDALDKQQGSIAADLYSGIMQSSRVELDRRSTEAQANDKLHVAESHSGVDLWYDDESSNENSVLKMNEASDMEREWQRRHDQFHTVGYRDGLIAGKEAAAQDGFNIGFKDSVLSGYNWGFVRGITSAMDFLPVELKEKLVGKDETRNKFLHLHESMQSISTTDALKLFYEDRQMKSSNEEGSDRTSSTMAVSCRQSSEIGDLKNYQSQLQSLLSDCPLLEGHLEVH